QHFKSRGFAVLCLVKHEPVQAKQLVVFALPGDTLQACTCNAGGIAPAAAREFDRQQFVDTATQCRHRVTLEGFADVTIANLEQVTFQQRDRAADFLQACLRRVRRIVLLHHRDQPAVCKSREHGEDCNGDEHFQQRESACAAHSCTPGSTCGCVSWNDESVTIEPSSPSRLTRTTTLRSDGTAASLISTVHVQRSPASISSPCLVPVFSVCGVMRISVRTFCATQPAYVRSRRSAAERVDSALLPMSAARPTPTTASATRISINVKPRARFMAIRLRSACVQEDRLRPSMFRHLHRR